LASFFVQDIRSVFTLFKRFLRPYLPLILILVFLNICTGFLQAALPLSVAPAVNIILGEKQEPAGALSEITLDNLGPTILHWFGTDPGNFMEVIVIVVTIYLLCTFVIASVKTLAFVLSAFVQGKALSDVITSLHLHILTLPISFFTTKREGDILSRFTSDSTATVNLLDALIRGLLQSFIQALFLLIVLFRTDALLALATIGIGAGHFCITRTLSGVVRRKTKIVFNFYGSMSAALQESLQNIRVTKCFAAEKFHQLRLESEVNSVRESLFKFRITRYIEEPFRLVADALSVCVMLFLAYYAMSIGELTKSGFGMFVFLASRIVVPISDFSKHFLSIFAVAGSADRLISIFALRTPLTDGAVETKPLRERIQFDDVTFSHVEGENVLKQVTIDIRKGEMVAVVGPSGGGKSTFCDLLLRLHDPHAGRIWFDEHDIREFKKASYLKQFGVVPQESLLLNASVKDNVVYGREWGEGNYNDAVNVANALEFIEKLPQKDETLIGDRGVRLSGGQRQRLAIARALYGMPAILVLDEATSSLDSESERLVQEAIDNAIRNMTAVVVAHRLSTVMHADKIIVMQEGRVEECGAHDELLETSKTYRRLVEMQFRSGRVVT
jgi:ABC-type multidrug transport system fused ATPase/permease subunit